MRRALVFLLLVGCGAFGVDDDDDDRPPMSGGPDADGGTSGGDVTVDGSVEVDSGTIDVPVNDGGGGGSTLGLRGINVMSSNGTASIKVRIPATQDGDLLVAILNAHATGGSPRLTKPPTWDSRLNQTSGNHVVQVWTRTVSGAAPVEDEVKGDGLFNGSIFVAAYHGATGIGEAKFQAYSTNQAVDTFIASPARDASGSLQDHYLLVATSLSDPLVILEKPPGFGASATVSLGTMFSLGTDAVVADVSGGGSTFQLKKTSGKDSTVTLDTATIVTIKD